jgi:hypothetical protein
MGLPDERARLAEKRNPENGARIGDRMPAPGSAHLPPQGIRGTVDRLLTGAPSMIFRLIAR